MNSLKLTRFPTLDYACNEAFNTLCTNLAFIGSDIKTIMITSGNSSDGKSFVSMNLVRNLAGLGKRVALVDADLRRSKLASRYKIQFSNKEKQGLSNYLAGVCDINSVVYTTNIENLFVIPAGHEVSNSLSLLNTPRMPNLLYQLRKQVDYVIVDAPPIGILIDAAEIAKYCDGTLFVVNYNKTRRRDLTECKRQIERSGCKLLGAVLNDVALDSYISRKYYYKSYYSNYYKGDGYDNTDAGEEKK